MTKREFWFVVGSQFLYGPEVLKTVEARAKEMAEEMSKKLPYPMEFKTIGVTCEGITNIIKEANYSDECCGFIKTKQSLSQKRLPLRCYYA